MDADRLSRALETCLVHRSRAQDASADELDDILAFLCDEVIASGVTWLPASSDHDQDATRAGSDASQLGSSTMTMEAGGQRQQGRHRSQARTLEELEVHSLTSVLAAHLVDLFQIQANDVALLIDEILDAYDDDDEQQLDDEKNTDKQRETVEYDDHTGKRLAKQKVCELCERPAPLTIHHLIPRSEHALLVKRGLFTQIDCECGEVA